MGAFERIRDSWVPIWMKGFERKNRDYNSANGEWENHKVLGAKGQFADIWRKVGKLKKSLWDDEKLEGEQPEEIIMDLISHLFLTYDLLVYRTEIREDQVVVPSEWAERCGIDCEDGHTYVGLCGLRLQRGRT